VITKATDEVRCGDERINALLNDLGFELIEVLLLERNFGDVLGQSLLQQEMIRMFLQGPPKLLIL